MENLLGTLLAAAVSLITIYLGFRHDKQNKIDSEIKRLAEFKADKTELSALEIKRREDNRSIYSEIKAKADKSDLCEMEKRIMDAISANNSMIQNNITTQNGLIRDIHNYLMNEK